MKNNIRMALLFGMTLLGALEQHTQTANAAMQLRCPDGWNARRISDYTYTCNKAFRFTLPASPVVPRPGVRRERIFELGSQSCDNHVQDVKIWETPPDAQRRFIAKVAIVCGFLT